MASSFTVLPDPHAVVAQADLHSWALGMVKCFASMTFMSDPGLLPICMLLSSLHSAAQLECTFRMMRTQQSRFVRRLHM